MSTWRRLRRRRGSPSIETPARYSVVFRTRLCFRAAMAPCSLLTAGLSLLAKSVTALSCSGSLNRCSRALPAAAFSPVRFLAVEASGPPKRPLNGYMRYVMQQKPLVVGQNPEIKPVDVIRKIAQQWRTMSPDQKRPFEEASLRAREQFKVELQRYQARLSPEQLQQQAQDKRQRMARRKAIRRKRELTSLGKPKRPRSPFNIFMSEHFEEARGVNTQMKMKSLMEDWRNLFSHQKKVYTQLAEDDKIRYKNEMKSWEDHMADIGREDLIREQTLSASRKRTTKAAAAAAAKKTPKSKSKGVKKASAGKKSAAMGRKNSKTLPTRSKKA